MAWKWMEIESSVPTLLHPNTMITRWRWKKKNETKRKRYEKNHFAVSFHSFEPRGRSLDIGVKRYQDLSNMLKEYKRALMKARQWLLTTR